MYVYTLSLREFQLMIQGHTLPFKSEAPSEFEGVDSFDDKQTPTIGSSTRLTSPGARAFA
jgi:hypothetical protein